MLGGVGVAHSLEGRQRGRREAQGLARRFGEHDAAIGEDAARLQRREELLHGFERVEITLGQRVSAGAQRCVRVHPAQLDQVELAPRAAREVASLGVDQLDVLARREPAAELGIGLLEQAFGRGVDLDPRDLLDPELQGDRQVDAAADADRHALATRHAARRQRHVAGCRTGALQEGHRLEVPVPLHEQGRRGAVLEDAADVLGRHVGRESPAHGRLRDQGFGDVDARQRVPDGPRDGDRLGHHGQLLRRR